MKKIFIVDEHQSSKKNGVGTFMQTFLSCLNALECSVDILSYNEDVEEFCIKEDSNNTIYCIPKHGNGRFLSHGWLSLPLLRMYINDSSDNIFFINHSPCLLFLKTLKKLFPKSKIVFIIHDQGWTAPLLGNWKEFKRIMSNTTSNKENEKKYSFIKEFTNEEKKIYALVDKVVCLNKSTYQLLIDIYNLSESKICLIPNGIHQTHIIPSKKKKEKLREKFRIPQNCIVLLFAARTTAEKGIFNVLEAFEQIWETQKNIHLIIAGEILYINEFTKLTPKSGTCVTYTGMIDKESLSDWYSIADIGLLPSFTEQCSYTALEMMAHRLPIITTDGNGLADMFQNKVNAIVIPACLQTLTANIVHAVLKTSKMEDKEIKGMAEEAYKTIGKTFSISAMKKKYKDIIQTL